MNTSLARPKSRNRASKSGRRPPLFRLLLEIEQREIGITQGSARMFIEHAGDVCVFRQLCVDLVMPIVRDLEPRHGPDDRNDGKAESGW